MSSKSGEGSPMPRRSVASHISKSTLNEFSSPANVSPHVSSSSDIVNLFIVRTRSTIKTSLLLISSRWLVQWSSSSRKKLSAKQQRTRKRALIELEKRKRNSATSFQVRLTLLVLSRSRRMDERAFLAAFYGALRAGV